MSGGDLLNVAVTGLLANQRSLATTSHNIANVNTDGYTRQRVELSTYSPLFTGSGFVGTGVKVDTIKRVYDQFLTDQLHATTASYSQLDRFHALASQVDNLFADSAAGLAPMMRVFF